MEQWCHLGSSAYLSDLAAMQKPLRFEYDTYKLLTKWLADTDTEAKITPLNELIITGRDGSIAVGAK